jgi:cold shock CspA family protein
MKPRSHQLEAAVDRAFHAARRRLEDFIRKLRGAVKEHRTLPTARVSKLLSDGGFITAPDGREIFFHRNALRGTPFERLGLGDTVSYVEEQAEKGPNAAVVRLVAHVARRVSLRPRSKKLRVRRTGVSARR